MSIASIISAARTAITKYKARRVHDVINNYVGLVDAQVVMIIPAVLDFYRRSATVVVDKTYENPEPAIKLLEALDVAAKHYGPALITEFKAFSAEHAERSNSSVVLTRLETLLQSINDLTTDVPASEGKAP